ncbi:MAG: hypothetical protein H6P98_1121 [Candidatus Aminicenantes bacterium]|nr:hypothetical protein [Candidatus Aminicenantes bacterium]
MTPKLTPPFDLSLLARFEQGLDPKHPEASPMPASILGYGEISTIFEIQGAEGAACKRMPLFAGRDQAAAYETIYREYCQRLGEAGLDLPEDSTAIIELEGRPVVLYILQRRFPPERFGHRLIHSLDDAEARKLIELIVQKIAAVWAFNEKRKPGLELALDGQVSNWVWPDSASPDLLYVDTSTPLLRRDGAEQLDPELFLKSAPSFLRWIIRLLFLKDVMNRYYTLRLVYTDLAANFFKEGRDDLVPTVLEAINSALPAGIAPLTFREIEKYYKGDKTIWKVFQAFRRFDRWMKTSLLGKRYELILPGKIRR